MHKKRDETAQKQTDGEREKLDNALPDSLPSLSFFPSFSLSTSCLLPPSQPKTNGHKKKQAASSATSATSLAQLRGQPKKGAGGKEEKAPGGGGGERGGKASRGGGGGALPSEAGGGGYLGDMDLPPSDSESDDATDPSAAEARRAERDLAALSLATAKDAKRAAER